LHTHVPVANNVQTLDGRLLSIDGRVLSKAAVAAVVMLRLASLRWTVRSSLLFGIEVGDAVIVDASRPLSGSRPITRCARPHRIGWHGGPQVFTGPTLSMINKIIVGRSKDLRLLCARVVGLEDGVWTGC
jgi:hypothetical protein